MSTWKLSLFEKSYSMILVLFDFGLIYSDRSAKFPICSIEISVNMGGNGEQAEVEQLKCKYNVCTHYGHTSSFCASQAH